MAGGEIKGGVEGSEEE